MEKKKRECHMLAPRKLCLDCSKVYCDVTERWLLAWNQNKHITYFMYYFQNQYWSFLHSLALRLMTLTSSLRDPSLQFADFHFGPCRGKFVDFPHLNHFSAIMDLGISDIADFRSFPFSRSLALLIRSPWSKLSNNIKGTQQQVEKKAFVSIKN